MDKRLTKDLPQKQKDEFRAEWLSSANVREQLSVLLENELKDSYKEMANKDNFFMPAWSEYQASRLGEQETLRKIINILQD